VALCNRAGDSGVSLRYTRPASNPNPNPDPDPDPDPDPNPNPDPDPDPDPSQVLDRQPARLRAVEEHRPAARGLRHRPRARHRLPVPPRHRACVTQGPNPRRADPRHNPRRADPRHNPRLAAPQPGLHLLLTRPSLISTLHRRGGAGALPRTGRRGEIRSRLVGAARPRGRGGGAGGDLADCREPVGASGRPPGGPLISR
jgi:hypothetical protein